METRVVVMIVVGVAMGILRGLPLAIKRRKDAKSDNIAVKAQALYELGCEEWGDLGGALNFILYGYLSGTASQKSRAIEYWIQAAKLGHEGAADKLRMAQMCRY